MEVCLGPGGISHADTFSFCGIQLQKMKVVLFCPSTKRQCLLRAALERNKYFLCKHSKKKKKAALCFPQMLILHTAL